MKTGKGQRPGMVLNPRHSVTVCSAKSQKKLQISAPTLHFFTSKSKASTCVFEKLCCIAQAVFSSGSKNKPHRIHMSYNFRSAAAAAAAGKCFDITELNL